MLPTVASKDRMSSNQYADTKIDSRHQLASSL